MSLGLSGIHQNLKASVEGLKCNVRDYLKLSETNYVSEQQGVYY